MGFRGLNQTNAPIPPLASQTRLTRGESCVQDLLQLQGHLLVTAALLRRSVDPVHADPTVGKDTQAGKEVTQVC